MMYTYNNKTLYVKWQGLCILSNNFLNNIKENQYNFIVYNFIYKYLFFMYLITL